MTRLVPFNTRGSVFGFGDFSKMLDEFFTEGQAQSGSLSADTFKLDVEENPQEFLVNADLPGFAKEEIKLNFEEGKLTIATNKTEESNEETKNYIHRERRASSVSRSVRLTDAVQEGISAKLANGVLTVRVPKKVKQEALQIEIE